MIKPDKHYTLKEIAEENLLGYKDERTVRKVVHTDMHTNNYLKASHFGIGKRSIWQVQGRNIIKYLAQKES